jgi:hypothetical protein
MQATLERLLRGVGQLSQNALRVSRTGDIVDAIELEGKIGKVAVGGRLKRERAVTIEVKVLIELDREAVELDIP